MLECTTAKNKTWIKVEREVGDGYFVVVADGDVNQAIGSSPTFRGVELNEKLTNNERKVYDLKGAIHAADRTYVPTDPQADVKRDEEEIPKPTCAVDSYSTAVYIAVEATKLMKDQMPELLNMTSPERMKAVMPLAIDMATMGNMLYEETQKLIDKMFNPGGDLG